MKNARGGGGEEKRLMHSNPETNRKNMSVTPPGGEVMR